MEEFDINSIDFSSPAAIQTLKESIIKEAYRRATSTDPKIAKTTASLKNVIEIITELERSWNIKREEDLFILNQRVDQLDETIDLLLTENSHLKSQLARYSQTEEAAEENPLMQFDIPAAEAEAEDFSLEFTNG